MLCAGALACACSQSGNDKSVTPWGETFGDSISEDHTLDLDQIQNNGELIMLTLSGPDSYYDYRGKHLGTQFLLCQRFADKIGVSLRVELCHDSLQMFDKLKAGEADVIAFPISSTSVGTGESDFILCGPALGATKARWVVTSAQKNLAQALNQWYSPSLLSAVKREESALLRSHGVRRRVFAPMQDRQRGIISKYDGLFIENSRNIRWDWRLLAAQCYQESTFDPNARSWAGACGLMQIMPETATHLGLPHSDLFDPKANIEAAVRYLDELEMKFSDIKSRRERLNFVLASYNGGYHHIRDAMRLTSKYGQNAKTWSNVSKYVLLLSTPQYYRDPAVKYGYMRGQETVDYVSRITRRWLQYKGVKTAAGGGSLVAPKKARHYKSKFKLSAGQ